MALLFLKFNAITALWLQYYISCILLVFCATSFEAKVHLGSFSASNIEAERDADGLLETIQGKVEGTSSEGRNSTGAQGAVAERQGPKLAKVLALEAQLRNVDGQVMQQLQSGPSDAGRSTSLDNQVRGGITACLDLSRAHSTS